MQHKAFFTVKGKEQNPLSLFAESKDEAKGFITTLKGNMNNLEHLSKYSCCIGVQLTCEVDQSYRI